MAGWLVVNADDLGVSKGATLGILKAHREGILTSASLAVTTPFYRHALATCVRTCPELGIGLHFTLTAGNPASDPSRVPLLVDATGRLRWRFMPLLIAAGIRRQGALLDQIGSELEAQLGRLRQDGIQPDHIDGERHVHLIPGIFERVVDAARRHGIRYVRAGQDAGIGLLTWRDAPLVIANGGLLKRGLLDRLSARARIDLGSEPRSPDQVLSYLYTGRLDQILDRVLAAPALTGVTELMLHPGLPEANGPLDLGNRETERYVRDPGRRAELQACLSARVGSGGWRLTNYRELARLDMP